jgi:hypothetical protein
MDATNGKCNKTKPFDGLDGKPLNVPERDGEDKNINVHHVGRRNVIDKVALKIPFTLTNSRLERWRINKGLG